MSRESAIEFMVVSRLDEPPAAAEIARGLSAVGLGIADYTPAPEAVSGSGQLAGRRRMGTHALRIIDTQATARVTVSVHVRPVSADMGEAAFNDLTRGLSTEEIRTLREGAVAVNVRVMTPRGDAAASLAWAAGALRVLVEMTQGVCIDPAAQRCYGRADLLRLPSGGALAHVAVHEEPWDSESRWLHTHGLQKFGSPEIDLVAVPDSLRAEARAFLAEVATTLAGGAELAAGGDIDMGDLGVVTALGVAVDVDHQAPFGRLRLADVPSPGQRQGMAATHLLARMALAEATRRAAAGDVSGGLQEVDRVLAADPDDCAALALKAALYLRHGRALDALGVGELIELRVPADHRGPLVVARALAALKRYPEALRALDRAIELDPESREAFASRAEVHARMGHEQLAAVDRAHAAYLAG